MRRIQREASPLKRLSDLDDVCGLVLHRYLATATAANVDPIEAVAAILAHGLVTVQALPEEAEVRVSHLVTGYIEVLFGATNEAA